MSRPIALHSLAVGVPDRSLSHGRWRERPAPLLARSERGALTELPLGPSDDQDEALADRHLERLETRVLAPARRTSNVEARLRGVVSSYASLAADEPGIMALVAVRGDRTGWSAAARRRIDRFVARLESDVTEILETQNRSSRVDSRVAALSLLGIIHWGICSFRAEGRLSRDEAVAQITFLALHGLVPEPPWHTGRPRHSAIAA